MNKLGIIGGLGPEATVYFLQLLIDFSEAKSDQEHLEYILYNCPKIPDRTSYILHKTENPVPELIKICKQLEASSVNIIAIPCITAHYFFEEMQKQTNAHLIDAVNETVLHLKKSNRKKIGIMATDGTIQTNLFQNELEKYGLIPIIPDENEQKMVMDIIYNQVKKGLKPNLENFEKVRNSLISKGADTVLLGCTELSILKRDNKLDGDVIDVLDVLAIATIENLKDIGNKNV